MQWGTPAIDPPQNAKRGIGGYCVEQCDGERSDSFIRCQDRVNANRYIKNDKKCDSGQNLRQNHRIFENFFAGGEFACDLAELAAQTGRRAGLGRLMDGNSFH